VLVVRSDGPNDVRLGIGEPAEGPHDESDWLLAFGPAREEQLNAGQIRKLPFTAEAKHAADALYAPPFQKTRFPARIAWLSVSASGFALVSQAQ
jgi:hypothetical protein